jgi:predicted helicase
MEPAKSPLRTLLHTFREASATEREKGTYFEELIVLYLKNEPCFRDLYSEVWTYGEWAKREGMDARDAGIDLVCKTQATGELHAVQCKLYAEDYTLKKADIDSFFTASGKTAFSHRIIVATTNLWSDHAEEALRDQKLPVSKIDLHDLENSQIDWSRYAPSAPAAMKPRKQLREHQVKAVKQSIAGLADGVADRGKLIMACGTGKTFTSLKIAERLAGAGGRVLFLVPSLSLLSQSLTEWTQESEVPLHSFAVCSDADVGKKRKKDADVVQTFTHELRYPATTNAERLAEHASKRHDARHMSVVFSTYHSLDVVSRAQHEHGLAAFDLVVCDEAHRTTGATFDDQDESTFVRIHDAEYLRAKKRLYMTATPRIYGNLAKASAERDNVALCSMDDEALYGKELHVITFSEAVKRGLLVDYKVVVLAVEEAHVSRKLQQLLKDENTQLKVDDAAKIVGCWKALSKQGLTNDLVGDEHPMKRAVAFCQVIEISNGVKSHKVSSKHIASMFQSVVDAYQEEEKTEERFRLRCEAEHVDGGMSASVKEEKLSWLKEDTEENTARILSNVRCLSEGVDVPALDAVLFLTPRNSQVDVVQSVGRVMRNAPGKKRGYVVLPVVIPAGVAPHEALNDNATYGVVWQVLQALRSHDDRFDAMVNKLDLGGRDTSKMEVIAITDQVPKKADSKKERAGHGTHNLGESKGKTKKKPLADANLHLEFQIGEIERAIYAKLVEKVGNRHHWEDWANDIAKIARTHIDRIQGILENPLLVREREAFDEFTRELRDDLNESITEPEIIEMLAQHLITRPVFEALFSTYSFASQNPISQAMSKVLEVLNEHRLDKETDTLNRFYESVKQRAEGIDDATSKQKIVVELYDKFFRNAFPRMTERLGIVYTPVEIVDFIIHSVDHLLRTEFGQTLGSEGVHIIDPFTGTGTFITRLLQSGLIEKEALPRKYKKEIHANEIVLLAYYIAAINIESTYHAIVGGNYAPFEGICLTDTFQLYEKDDLISRVLVDNSARRVRQKKLDIRVIFGNPPYSIGQGSQNDNNQNVGYPSLDARIAETYAARSSAALSRGVYDSYVRAIRWASDRIGHSGIIGFVTNANFVDGTANGLRKCLVDEFSSLYIFHLRGNQRTAGELSRREGGKVFGSGSRAPVAISLLVKNPESPQHGRIHFRDIGDYLTREEKLGVLQDFVSVAGVNANDGWTIITPDEHGDWRNQRNSAFDEHLPLGVKRDGGPSLFDSFSLGVVTARDAWAYNSSRRSLAVHMNRMVAAYNADAVRFDDAHHALDRKARALLVDDFVDADPTRISWSANLKADVVRSTRLVFDEARIVQSLYRPYSKLWLYFDRKLNERVLKIPNFFPQSMNENRVIGVSASESRSGYSVLMADVVPSLHATDMVGSQYFPLYLYDGDATDDEATAPQTEIFASPKKGSGTARRDGITDAGLAHFQEAYPGETLTKEDVFYYVYGLLHSANYRERYKDNLGKELPRIPRVKTAADFWSFSRAGRALGELHVGYERVAEYPAKVELPSKTPTPIQYRVEKMKFGAGKDKRVIQYNGFITVRDIPLEAYEYVVNGKPAIEWVMERQSVTTDKDSGIVKDANDWATETMGDARYPLSLLLRVITVSLETMKLVRGLPRLELD